jgi:hypothetical protein
MHDLKLDSAVALNTLRKDGFLPYLLPRSLAGEIREGEQAAISQQPARSLVHIRQIAAWLLWR